MRATTRVRAGSRSTTPLWPSVDVARRVRAARGPAEPSAQAAAATFPRARPSHGRSACRGRGRRPGSRRPCERGRSARALWLAPADDRSDARRTARQSASTWASHSARASTRRRRCASTGSSAISRAAATLLDYGCGSGVLALAALALGARRACAVDNDPQAMLGDARQRGAQRRSPTACSSRARRSCPPWPSTCSPPTFWPGPLIELAPKFAAHVRAGRPARA